MKSMYDNDSGGRKGMNMNEDERVIISCDRCKTDISDRYMCIIDCEKAVYVPKYKSKL